MPGVNDVEAVQKWCQWCDKEHAIDHMCPEAFAALKDLANLGEGVRPPRHYASGATLDDIGIDPATIEPIRGLGFSGGAVQVFGEWQVVLIIQTESPDGEKYPARVLLTPLEGFERLADWTAQVFSETIARTRELMSEEGQ